MTARYLRTEIPKLKKKDALALKEAVGRKYPKPGNQQTDKIRQIAFNLKQNLQVLKQLSPDAIVELNDEEWRKWLPRTEEEEQKVPVSSRDTLKNLLSIDTLDQERLAANAPMIICRQCKGAEIAYTSQHIRSADEPAVIFCFCQNPLCGFKWNMR